MLPRSLPPTTAPLRVTDILAAVPALVNGGEREQVRFREEIGRRFGVKHVFLSSSGKASLVQLLKAMASIRPGKDEVLLPAYTSFSVPSAVVAAGFKVALYDLDPQTLSPDLPSLERAVTVSTLCVVVCHLFGYPADVDAVRAVMRGSGAFLVDDAAQAMGARYQGRPVGTRGDAGLFSLGRGKPITAVEGGIAVTDSVELAAALTAVPPGPLPWHRPWLIAMKAAALVLLQRPGWYWIPRALPFLKVGESFFSPDVPVEGFSGFQASLGRRMLRRLDEINAARRALVQRLIGKAPAALKSSFVRPLPGAEPICLRLPILAEHLPVVPSLGIVASYPQSLNQVEPLLPSISGRRESCPGAAKIAARLRTLPTHAFVTEQDCAAIDSVLDSAARSAQQES